MAPIPSIDKTKLLKGLLGQAKVDRIRYAQRGKHRRQPGAVNVVNTVLQEMQWIDPKKLPHGVGDVLRGFAHADTDGDKGLSTARLFNVFFCMSIINTREVMAMMAVNERQARRYVRAAKLALPYLEKELKPGGTNG